MTLQELFSVLNIDRKIKKNIKINSFKTNSNLIKKNDVFIALKGNKYNGNNYAISATLKGACIAIVDENINNINCIKVDSTYEVLEHIIKYIRNKYKDIPLIGITGSNGKTTTKDLIYYILSSKYKVLSTSESKNNIIGIFDTFTKLNNIYDVILMELGSNHIGEINNLSCLIKPDTSIITNIGTSHIEYFKSKKNIYKEKLSIINGMDKVNLIVNGDDKYLRKINCYKCGINKNNNFKAYNIREYSDKICFNIFIDKEYEVIFNNPGRHFINNILLAIKVCLDFNIDINTIIERIKTFKLTNKRMNIIKLNSNILINDCYNASLESVMAGLNYLEKINNNKVIILSNILEIGKHEKEIYKKINNKMNKLKNIKVYTIGHIGKYIKGYNFKNNEEFINYIINNKIQDSCIYVKGSRKTNLDEVVNYFIKNYK